MKLYLAFRTDTTLMEGDFESVLGVYSTPDKALARLKEESFFNRFTQVGDIFFENVVDGEWTITLEVKEIELDKEIV